MSPVPPTDEAPTPGCSPGPSPLQRARPGEGPPRPSLAPPRLPLGVPRGPGSHRDAPTGNGHHLPNCRSPAKALLRSPLRGRLPAPCLPSVSPLWTLPAPPRGRRPRASPAPPRSPCGEPPRLGGPRAPGSRLLLPARLASPRRSLGVKKAIFSLCYPRNYPVSVLPWCLVLPGNVSLSTLRGVGTRGTPESPLCSLQVLCLST